jgi:nucleoside-diphosphate-sugar epimerase
MTVLISGVSGFLGSHLVEFLSSYFNVIGINGRTKKLDVRSNNRVKLYDADDLEKIREKPDVIIMCHAAVASGDTKVGVEVLSEGNISFSKKIMDLFPETNCVYISSVSVYGASEEGTSELSPVDPLTDYAASKFDAEKMILSRKHICIVRFSSLYGIKMKENTLIPVYCNQALGNGVIEVWGNGERKQNYLHVSDAVSLIKAVIDQSRYHKEIFLGTSLSETSNNEIAQIIEKETGSRINYSGLDTSISVNYNNSFTRDQLNWQPVKNINEGLSEYIKWKKKQF